MGEGWASREAAVMLARQILGDDELERRLERVPPAEVSSAQAMVEINLKSMVRQIRQQVWVDSAAIARRVEAQLLEAASTASIDKVVAEAVRYELDALKRDVHQRVRKVIDERIALAISDKLKTYPQQLASKIAEDMVGDLWDRLLKK